MRISVLDSRNMAVYFFQVSTSRWYNATTGGWDTVFVAANHLSPLAHTGFASGPATTLVSASVPGITEWTDVVTVTCTVTGTGAAIAWVADVDVIQGPPAELPVRYVWPR